MVLIRFASILIITCCASLFAQAEDLHEINLKTLISGDVEGMIKAIESEKDFDWDKNKIDLNEKNSELYSAALIITGDKDKAEKFLKNATIKHPKNQVLKNHLKQLEFFEAQYENAALNYNTLEQAHFSLMSLFPQYLELASTTKNSNQEKTFGPNINNDKDKSSETIKSSQTNSPQIENLKKQILNLIDKTDNRTAYFPTKLEYLLELNELDKARDEATKIIEKKRDILFFKTPDLYELAMAYRTIAISTYRSSQNQSMKELENARAIAEKFYRLALVNVSKMKSIWLEEDLVVGRLLPKRQTKIGCVLPQWIIKTRTQLETEYEILLNEK